MISIKQVSCLEWTSVEWVYMLKNIYLIHISDTYIRYMYQIYIYIHTLKRSQRIK